MSDFTNIGNPQTAINWPYFLEVEFTGLTTIEANEIAGNVTNYDVPNYDTAGDKTRYPNIDSIGVGGTFTKTGTGIGQKHLRRLSGSGNVNNFLIVNGGEKGVSQGILTGEKLLSLDQY